MSAAWKAFCVPLPPIDVSFDLTEQDAGLAQVVHGEYKLRLNYKMMMRPDGWEHIYNNTIPHEIAHLVCCWNPDLGKNHDAGWRDVCIRLGGDGEQCHLIPVIYERGKTFAYITDAGYPVNVTGALHSKVQKGSRYMYEGLGKIDNTCSFELVAEHGEMIENNA